MGGRFLSKLDMARMGTMVCVRGWLVVAGFASGPPYLCRASTEISCWPAVSFC